MSKLPGKRLLAAGIVLAMSQMAIQQVQAADVPAGVTLAAKQELIKGNGGEVQSLDPHKIEGSPESNVSYDLLEGLAVVGTEGKVIPGWQRAGKIKTVKSGLSIYVKMLSGRMVPR